MKIKKGDLIQVMAGRDRGREVQVESVLLKKGEVFLPGINQYKKHRKPMNGQPGEILTLSRPMDVSKVALVCPKCKKPTRVGYKMEKDKKVRFCRKCKEVIN